MKKLINQIKKHGIEELKGLIDYSTPYGADLHHELYNMSYFIVGTAEAKKFLNKYGVFEAIDKVTTYEKDMFGEISTDISNPEKLVNMLAYIIGEELLSKCPTLQTEWHNQLSKKDLKLILRELRKAEI